MQRRRHGDGRQVGRAVTAGSHLIEVGKRGDLPQMGQAARMDDGRTDIVDQPVLDQMLGIPYRVEDFSHRQRGRCVLADQRKASWSSRGWHPRSRRGDKAPDPCPVARPRSGSAGGGRRGADARPSPAPPARRRRVRGPRVDIFRSTRRFRWAGRHRRAHSAGPPWRRHWWRPGPARRIAGGSPDTPRRGGGSRWRSCPRSSCRWHGNTPCTLTRGAARAADRRAAQQSCP